MGISQVHQFNLEKALLSMNKEAAEEVIRLALTESSPITVAGELISKALSRIGEMWENGGLSLAQVYMCGIICEQLIDKVMPPASPQRQSQPKMAIAVLEDYHLLGKRIILSTLRASGYEVLDLGGGLSIEQLVEAVNRESIELLLVSVLMLPSALRIKDLRQRLPKDKVKIIVGGAPFRFDTELWREVDADFCGRDSMEAIVLVNMITSNHMS